VKATPAIRLIFLFFSLLPLWLAAQDWLDAPVSFQAENASRSTILFYLSDDIGFDLGFDGKLPGMRQKIMIDAKDVPLSVLIRQILEGTNLTFTVKERRIVLRLKPPSYFTFSGFLEDASSGERLVAGSVYDPSSGRGTITNSYGFFSLQLPAGERTVQFSYLGFQTKIIMLDLQEATTKVVHLNTDNNLPEIVVTSGEDDAQGQLIALGRQYTGAALRRQRSLGGEASLFDLIHQNTASQRGADGLGGLFVRGGGADQNLVLLDDVPIFQPSHSFGLFSVINPAIMRSAKFYQDGIPARFGGRLASVLDVRSREGNTQKGSTEIEFTTIATKIKFEQPLAQNTGALLFAARRTHLDPVFKFVSQQKKNRDGSLGTINYHFYDLNLKWHQQVGKKDRLFASFYRGGDTYRNDDLTEYEQVDERDNIIGSYTEDIAQDLSWGNTSGSLRWNHLFNDQTFANTTLTYGHYGYQSYNTLLTEDTSPSDTLSEASYASFSSEINELRLKFDIDHYAGNHHWQFGFSGLVRGFIPGAVFDEFIQDTGTEIGAPQDVFEDQEFPSYGATEFALYASDDFAINTHLSVSAGLRLGLFNSLGTNFLAPEPRLRLAWKPSNRWSSTLSVVRMRQPIHLLTTSGASLPTDLWVPANNLYQPQDSWQISLTNSFRPNKAWKFGFQSYLRQMRNLLQYAQDVDFPGLEETPTEFWEDNVVQGQGHSFGASANLGYERKNLAVSAGYFYQRSFREFAEVNGGEVFPFAFERPHKLNFNLSKDLQKGWRLHLHWEYASGRPITLIQSETQFDPLDNFPTTDFVLLTETNAFRLPAYHRLDVSVARSWEKTGKRHELQLGIYNVYNRANTYFTYELNDFFGEAAPEQRNVRSLPVLPSLSYGIGF